MVDEVRDVPGVAVAEGSVTGFALILDKNGEPIQPGGAPTFGASIGDTRLAGDFAYRQGPHRPGRTRSPSTRAPPNRPASISATGSTWSSRTAGRPSPWSAIIGFGENDSLLGATMAGFDLATAQRLSTR